jgi:hypothetical protein
VRDLRQNAEVPVPTYEALQTPRAADAGLFRKVLLGLSCRNYQACAEAVPAAFGLSASTVSRRFIRASGKQLQALQERRLDGYDVLALVLGLGDVANLLHLFWLATSRRVRILSGTWPILCRALRDRITGCRGLRGGR